MSSERIIIRGGCIVNADREFVSDILIERGIIKEIGTGLVAEGAKQINAAGNWVLPGGIDPHVHMSLRFMGTEACDDFYSGTRAAVAGGTTTIIDFAIPESPSSSLVAAYERYRSMADPLVCCDYALHVAVTGWRDGISDKEMEELVQKRGVNSFKCFMAYKDSLMLRDSELIKVFDTSRRIGALAMVHAENGDVIDHLQKKMLRMGITGPEGHLYSRPEQVEAEATQRAVTIANQLNCPLYVVHVMSKSAAEVIQRERANNNCLVIGETLASAIGTDGSHVLNRCWRHAAGHVMSPPLRPDSSTSDKLINLIENGTLLTVGSDHCVFDSKQKALGTDNFAHIPNGCNGVEERLMVLWERGVKSGKLSRTQFVAATSTNVAKIFNLYPRKGIIAVGSDADLVVWGPKQKTIRADSHQSNVDFNIFEGMKVSHSPIVVVSGGRIVLDESGIHVRKGDGKFLETPPHCEFVYSRIGVREKIKLKPVDRSPETFPTPVVKETNGSVSNGTAKPKKENLEVKPAPAPEVKSERKGSVQSQPAEENPRASIRVHNPPGGRSSGIW